MAYQVTAGRFIGRTQELARLRHLLARATDSDDEPLVALLGGEAGVGKTRLVEQLSAAASAQGVRVLSGRCVPLGEEGVPFAPVIEALRGLAGELDPAELAAVAGPARADLGRLLPDLGWGGEAAAAAEVAGAGQGRLFELLLGVIQRLAARGPLLWVMEDLHWADRSTRDLLAFLAAALRSGPVLVVGTFRSDELHRAHPLRRLLGELARNRRVQWAELQRFTRAELAEQLAALLGADPPARVADALEVGIEPGGPPAGRTARLAYHWSAAGEQPRALAASVAAASAAERVYAFAETQLQLERVLGLWDRVPGAEARAGMDRVRLLSRCAEATYAAGDVARAVQLVRQALPLVDEVRQPQRAGLLHEQLARYLRLLGDPAALGEQQEAVRLVAPAPSAERARVLGSLARLLVYVDRFAEARELAEEAAAIAGQAGARAEEADARAALGGPLVQLGDPDAGLAELEAAVRLATQADNPVVALRAILSRSDVLLATGRLEEAATVALDGIEQARRLGLARFVGPFLAGNATEALFALGRWDQAERVSRQGLEVAASDVTLFLLLPSRAALELGLGDLDSAEARLRTLRLLLPAPITEAQKAGPLFTGLAELALWRGDPDQAGQLVAEAFPLVEANPRYAAPVYALGLRIEADRAELARARRPGQPAPDDGTATALLQRLGEAAADPAADGIPELAAWHALGLGIGVPKRYR